MVHRAIEEEMLRERGDSVNIRFNYHGIVGVVDNKAGLGA